VATKPPDSLAELSLGERAAIGRIEKALFGGDDRLVEVGRYEVGALIGSGAFGKVYRARDPELAREVALKVTAASDADRDELMREARVMATIRHPNVAAVHDAGIVGASVFIAMELVTGVSLRQRGLRRKMNRQAAEHAKTDAKQNVSAEGSRAATIDILCQAGRGLAAAHAAGIVHRDFKPENVLVDDTGRAQVIDFGLAHVGGADARVAGTPAYMAPELLAFRPADETIDPLAPTVATDRSPTDGVDGRGNDATSGAVPRAHESSPGRARAATQASDQFAFGVTFCEAMFGARPFAGSTLAELRASLERPPVLPRDRLRPILTRALSRDPAGRFPSVTGLVDAIERTESRVSRWWIAVGATAVVAGVVAFVVMRGREPADPCPLPVAELEGAWDAAARATVATAMHSVPRGDEIFARVSVKLDRAAVAWLEARHDACVATAVRHDQSPQMLDRRVACLRGWKRQLAGITHVLARPAPDTLAAAPRVLDDLPSLSRCRDPTRWPPIRHRIRQPKTHSPMPAKSSRRDTQPRRSTRFASSVRAVRSLSRPRCSKPTRSSLPLDSTRHARRLDAPSMPRSLDPTSVRRHARPRPLRFSAPTIRVTSRNRFNGSSPARS